jgi:hypothetical protein
VLTFTDFKVPFVLTTDASTVGLGAVLSQVQEGVERLISFESRQLNKAESAYSASELQTLAVVWATKYFSCYLYGKKIFSENRPCTSQVLYRRVKDKQPKLVVPQTLIQDVIAENHNPIFVAHPGSKRTFELISLKYWWPKIRQSIEEYIRRCDKCQTRKSKQEFRAPLGEVETPSETFQVVSLDITGPYFVTSRKNRYLLTFIDHFFKVRRSFSDSGRFGRNLCKSLRYTNCG